MLFDDAKWCVLLDRLDLFRRTQDVQKEYDKYVQSITRNGISVSDVIVKKMDGHRIAWMRNEYPYNVNNAAHHLIWSTEPLSDEKIVEIATNHAGGREFVRFVNPPKLKSVPDMWHCHVLISTHL
jgi:hypothetical protein